MIKTLSSLLLLALLISCTKKETLPEGEKPIDVAALQIEVKDVFQPLPDSIIDVVANKDLIDLGKKLYFEKRLSVNDTISCNSCHDLAKYGVDNEPTSPGHEGKRGGRNSPTSLNAALHIAQFWDGRSPTVETQALGPILNPVEMGMPNEAAVIKKLKKDSEYVSLFAKAFPKDKSPLKYKNVGVAIGAYERTLLTPSRFDDFLKGQKEALTATEIKGLQKFVTVGCVSCHNGVGIGGGMYQKLGLVESYETKDEGRFNVTKDPEDKHVFKVPSLRNVIHTGPWFHDGSITQIESVIKIMGKHQLGVELKDDEIQDIKAFLGSLVAKELPKI